MVDFVYPDKILRNIAKFFLLLSSIIATAQTEVVEKPVVDSLYREDQFYLNVTNNALIKTPIGFDQNRFSPGISLGFLRDMPINKKRNVSVALGFGYSLSVLNQNIAITENNLGYQFATIAAANYQKNKLSIHYIDIPFEVRWRTSNPINNQFWRIYSGFKLSYQIYNQYKFEGNGTVLSLTNIPQINKTQYGCYLAAGYDTLNVYFFYGLNPIFNLDAANTQNISAAALNFGLQFYIL